MTDSNDLSDKELQERLDEIKEQATQLAADGSEAAEAELEALEAELDGIQETLKLRARVDASVKARVAEMLQKVEDSKDSEPEDEEEESNEDSSEEDPKEDAKEDSDEEDSEDQPEEETVTDEDLHQLIDDSKDVKGTKEPEFTPATGTLLGEDGSPSSTESDSVDTVDGEKILVNASGSAVTTFSAFNEDINTSFKSIVRPVTGAVQGDIIPLGSIIDRTPHEVTFSADDAIGNLRKLNEQSITLNAAVCCPRPTYIENRTQYCTTDNLFVVPTIQAPRGCVEMMVDDSACDVEFTPFEWGPTCGPDAKTEEELGEKPCQELPCDDEFRKAFTKAYGWCFTIDNGTDMWYPEIISNKIATRLCKFEHELAKIRLNTVLGIAAEQNEEACALDGGPMIASILEIIMGWADDIRSSLCNNRLRLEVIAPNELRNALLLDGIRRGGSAPSISQVEQAANVSFRFYDFGLERDDPCEMIEDFPLIIQAPGAVRELRAGDIDFGVMRDSVLSKKNKFQIMFETFRGMILAGPKCAIGSYTIEGVCANGAVGPRVDVCAAADAVKEA